MVQVSGFGSLEEWLFLTLCTCQCPTTTVYVFQSMFEETEPYSSFAVDPSPDPHDFSATTCEPVPIFF